MSKNLLKNENLKTKIPNSILKWSLGILILSFGSQYFTEIESNWINSYLKYYTSSGNNSFVSLMVSLNNIIGTIFFILYGVISDNIRGKLGRRLPFILLGTFGTALVLFSLPFVYSTIVLLILAGVVSPILSNGMHMAGKVIVPDLIPQNKRGRLNTFVTLMANLASIIVWILSLSLLPPGSEIYSYEVHKLFILSGCFVLILTGLQAFFLLRENKIETPPRNWRLDLKNLINIKEFRENKNFFVVFLGSLFVLMSQFAYLPFLLILVQEIDFNLVQILLALPIVGGVIGLCLFLVLKYIDKIGRKKVVLTGLTIAPIGSIILILNSSTFNLITGLAIMMPLVIIINIGVDTWIQDLLPEESRGKYMGFVRLAHGIGQTPGVILAGILADLFGIMYIFLAAGIILWCSIPIFLKAKESLKINTN